MSTPAAPAAVTPAAATVDAPVVKKGPPKASDHLSTLETKPVGGEGGGAAPAAQQPVAVPPKAEETEVESRLTKLAGERRKLDQDRDALKAEREKFAAEQAETARKAGLWDKLEAAKTGGKAMDVLRQLYDQDAIDTKVYKELTQDILAREPGEPLSPQAVQDLVDARLKAEKEADAKKAEEAKAEAAQAARKDFLTTVEKAFDPAKYPAVAKFQVTGAEVLKFTEEHFAEHDEIPSPTVILEHFEKLRREEAAAIVTPKAAETALPSGVTNEWKSGATPDGRDYSKMTRAERWAHDKREAGIEPS
jgi:hypothetical protein